MTTVWSKIRQTLRGLLAFMAFSVLICAPALAIESDRMNSQLTHRSWNSQSGLPSDAVWDVHVADDGYLWLATEAGLVRFDGFEFQVFNSLTHDAFSVDDTRRIAPAADGSLWISTYGGGVVHMAGDTFRRYDVADGIDNPVVYGVMVAKDGTVWAGTATSACRLSGERFTCFDADDGLASNRIFGLAQSRDETLWFSSLAGGASSFDGDSFTNFSAEFGKENQPIFVVKADLVFDIILGTYLGEFFSFNGDTFDRVDFPGLPKGMSPIEFHRDQQNNVWVGSNTHGLMRVLPGYRGFDGTLSEAQVFSIAEDSDGSLWLGTTSGLHYLSAPSFVPWGEPEGLADDTFVVAEAPDGSMWSGTEAHGIFRLGTDGVIENYTEDDGMPAPSVSTVMIEPDGLVWAGTFSAGIAWLRDGKVIGTLSEEDGLASNQVAAIERDSDGVVWIGTANGLHRFSDGKITHRLSREDGLGADLVRHISATDDGRLLLSTESGLVIVDAQKVAVVTILNSSDGLGSDIVATSYVDERGVIWIGGRSGGLSRVENGNAFSFTPEHQLGIDSIMGIVEDDSGYLWLGGRNGVSRIARDQLDAVSDGAAARVETRPIKLSDGLRALRVTGGFHAPIVLGRDGRVWLATGAGLAVADLAKMKPRGSGLNVRIDQVVADGERVPIVPEMTLPPGTHAIQLSYSVPLLRDGDALRFRYRLSDSDGRWQEAGIRRTAFFTSLSPRDYVLEVQATLDGLPFSDSGANTRNFQFTIAPLWYQTNAARFTTWVVALLLLWLLIQHLLRSARRREQRLELLVAERTGALTTALDKVQHLSRTDTLTQVANRRHFEEQLEESWACAEVTGDPISVMIIDIDHFKAFNDTAGHQAGDHALKTVAQTLDSDVRDQDFVARYGGEEFIILLSGTDIDVAQEVGRRVQKSIRDLGLKHPGLGDGEVLTVSAGFAAARPGDIGNAEALIRRADKALYRAKADGRDRLVTDKPEISRTGTYTRSGDRRV